jgi:hypothetical protein
LVPLTSASLKGVGVSPTGLDKGSYVFGFYLDGKEKQKPIMLGTFPKIPDMDDKKHDVSPLARGDNIIKKEKLGPEPKSPYAAEYPHNKVTKTKSGHAIELDDTPDAERIHIYHKSGSYEEVGPDGTRVTKTVKDNYSITAGDDEIYIKGNAKVTIKGKCTVAIDGDCSLTAKNVNVTAKQNVKVKAKKITLN